MLQPVTDLCVALRSGNVQIEQVLPGFSGNRTRFDLEEVDTPQSEHSERPEQRPGNILDGKHQTGFRFAGPSLRPTGKNKKTGVIVMVALDVAAEDPEVIGLCCTETRQRRSMSAAFLFDHLCRAGRVVARNRAHPLQPTEKFLALTKGLRMRQNEPNIPHLNAGQGHEMVMNLESNFADD